MLVREDMEWLLMGKAAEGRRSRKGFGVYSVAEGVLAGKAF
jgi:hypothetical protein